MITQSDKRKIAELYKAGNSISSISRMFGVSFNTVCHALGGTYNHGNRHYKIPEDISKLAGTEPAKKEPETSETLSLRDELRRVKTENSRLKTSEGYDSRLFSAIKESIPALPAVATEIKTKKTHGVQQEAVLIVTDAHAEELVNPDEMEGAGEYNLEVFEKRMSDTVDKTCEITDIIRRESNVDTINVFYLGDWFMGEIHIDESSSGSSATLPMAIPRVARAVAEQVMKLARVFRHVNVYGLVGNHGRNTHKPVTKMRVDRNWDAACYKIAEEFTRNQKNITWTIPKSIMYVADVMGWKCLLTHGDCVKRTSAEPLFALSRMIDMQHKQRRYDDTDFDYAFIGHWHDDSMLHGECEICPPLIGGSQYSRYTVHQSTPPGALLYFFTEEHGKTSRWRLNLN